MGHNSSKTRKKSSANLRKSENGGGGGGGGGLALRATTTLPKYEAVANDEDDCGEEQKCPKFTLQERKCVQKSWQAMERRIVELGPSSYVSLFRRSPETLSLFPLLQKLDIRDPEFERQIQNHALRLVGAMAIIVPILDNPSLDSDLKGILMDLGRRHQRYGVRPDQIELLGYCFLETLDSSKVQNTSSDIDCRLETKLAWRSLMDFVVFWMKNGHEQMKYSQGQ